MCSTAYGVTTLTVDYHQGIGRAVNSFLGGAARCKIIEMEVCLVRSHHHHDHSNASARRARWTVDDAASGYDTRTGTTFRRWRARGFLVCSKLSETGGSACCAKTFQMRNRTLTGPWRVPAEWGSLLLPPADHGSAHGSIGTSTPCSS